MNGREEKTSPLRLAWDLAMPCRADLVYILKDSCFAVIAALLFRDMEQDPGIVAEARRSNVHTPMSHGQPDGPTRLGRYQQGLQALNIGDLAPPAAFPLGHAAGGWFRHAQPPASRTHRRLYPRWHRRPEQSPRGRRLKASFPHPHRSPSVGARSLSPISARACPAPRVSAPRPAPAKTPTPRI